MYLVVMVVNDVELGGFCILKECVLWAGASAVLYGRFACFVVG